MSQRVDQLTDALTGFGSKTDEAAPEEPSFEDFRSHRSRGPFESDERADAEFLARMDERLPDGFRMFPKQETLGGAARWNTASEQTGGKDARVVDDQDVPGPEQSGELGNHSMSRASVVPRQNHQPRFATRRRRLRDQFLGQIEIKVGDEQRRAMLALRYNFGPGMHASRTAS